MLAPGEPIPEVAVWTSPNRSAPLRELLADGPILFLFYLFDWSST